MTIFNMSKYIKDKEKHIEDFERNTGIELIDHDIDSLDELEDEYDEFNQMTYKQRKVSNAKSEELYGMDNHERYNKLKSDFLKDNDEIYDEPTILYAESNIEFKKQNSDNIIKIEDYDDKIKIAKEWSEKALITIITPRDNMNELEKLWNEWNSMHDKPRKDSDAKSIELFGMNNTEHYNKLKSKFLKLNQGMIKDSEKENTVNTISSNEEKIKGKTEEIKSHIESGNSLEAYKCLLELSSIKPEGVYEEILINNAKSLIASNDMNKVNRYYETLNDLPYFLPEELESMGVYYNEGYYGIPDNEYLDNEKKIPVKEWFDCYNRTINGFLNEDYNKYTSLRINKLHQLYNDFESIKESGDINKINARKQSILELGWNPEIDFSLENRKKVSNSVRNKLKMSNNMEVLDITEFYNNCEPMEYVYESKDNTDKVPLFIVLSYNGDLFSKIITKYTKGKFSHSALGLEPELDRLYSYNVVDKGFTIESLEGYQKKNSESSLAVMCTFITKEQLKKIKINLDFLIANKNKTRYSVTNIIGIGLNKDFEFNINMICSQFVDRMLKMVNVDFVNKPSGLVTPNDFYINTSSKIYKIYEGNVMEYNSDKVRTLIKKLQKNSNYVIKEQQLSILNESQFIESINNNIDTMLYLNENSDVLPSDSRVIYETYIKPYTDIYYYNEAKEFPVQFDKDGNLLIKNMKKINFEAEYSKSHKLLLIYDENNNIEGMKYELSKLWFMNNILESKIYNEKIKEENKKELHKVRARILNDFNKYLKVVTSNDSDFNFTAYYNETPFSDATIKIDKHTIQYGVKIAKLLTGKIV